MKRRIAIGVSLVAALALAIVPAISADATTTALTGPMNAENTLYTSATFRYHAAGDAWMTYMAFNYWCDGTQAEGQCYYLTLGLKNSSNTQITKTGLTFNPYNTSTKQYFETTSGSKTIPAAYYAFNWKANEDVEGLYANFPQSWTGDYNY